MATQEAAPAAASESAASADDVAEAVEVVEGIEAPAPDEAAAATTEAAASEGGEEAAEGAAAAPAAVEIPEDVLKAAAVKHANKTMAAARRAERAVESVKTENASLTQQVKVYEGFVEDLRGPKPMEALARVGFKTFREFVEHVVATGGEGKAETADERVTRLERQLKERDEASARASTETQVTEFRDAVFNAVDENKADYARTATNHGKAVLWGEIQKYAKLHKLNVHQVPDVAVGALAREVEKDLRADFGDPVSGSPPAKKGNTAAAPAASAASNSGKTLAGKATSGAPKTREYSMDPDERRRQVNEDLLKEGLLTAGP